MTRKVQLLAAGRGGTVTGEVSFSTLLFSKSNFK